MTASLQLESYSLVGKIKVIKTAMDIQQSLNILKRDGIWVKIHRNPGHANVKFLAKPGKDSYYTGSSYRPISLTSVLKKCMERIIHARLYAFAEHHKILDFRARWV